MRPLFTISLLQLSIIAALAVLAELISETTTMASYSFALACGVFFVFIWHNKAKSIEASLAINDIRDAIVITKTDGLITGINTAGQKLFGQPSSDAKTIEELFHTLHSGLTSREEADTTLQTILQAPTITYQDILHTVNGNTYKRTTQPIEGGKRRIWHIRDVSQQKAAASDQELGNALLEKYAEETAEMAEQLYITKGELELQQERLRHIANTDMMTGLCSRHHFLVLANEKVMSGSNNIQVLMLDLDHFKKVNDTYGHAAGDQVIQIFADIITRVTLEESIASRIGGEEFAVIIPDATQENAVAIAERIRSLTADNVMIIDGNEFRFTCSIGIACHKTSEDTIERALDRSDKALYTAKQNGRNQVKIYQD